MKKIGFLSFGHWMDQGSLVKTAQDSYLQSIDLAVEAEKLELMVPIIGCIILPIKLAHHFHYFQRLAQRQVRSKSVLA